jgi:predicted nuclease of predicted toxin-antitoxin system
MQALLPDEGLPRSVAEALRAVDIDAYAIGDVNAPSRSSTDEENIRWCSETGRVLVTNDRGRRDRVILSLLNQHHVHALFVYNELRAAPPRDLLRALLCAESALDARAQQRGLIADRLKRSGRLERRRSR